MKTKPAARKPRMNPMAKKLFNIGMDAWIKVDKTRNRSRFNEIDNPGQIAGWNAIAKYVSGLTK